jgi:hypothetical protein
MGGNCWNWNLKLPAKIRVSKNGRKNNVEVITLQGF